MSVVYIRDAHFPVLGKLHCTFDDARADKVFRWLVFKIVDIIRYRAVQHSAVLVSGIITNVLIIISVLSAFPWVRKLVSPCSIQRNRD
jgi:hypothetical protein